MTQRSLDSSAGIVNDDGSFSSSAAAALSFSGFSPFDAPASSLLLSPPHTESETYHPRSSVVAMAFSSCLNGNKKKQLACMKERAYNEIPDSTKEIPTFF